MQRRKILVVEDDEDIRNTLKEVLQSEGFDVLTAENGQEGVDALRQQPRPSLILLDLMMPVMNGWEFLRLKGEDSVLATIPVIVVSAAGDRAGSVPAQAFVKKPVELELLLRLVTRYCDPKQTA